MKSVVVMGKGLFPPNRRAIEDSLCASLRSRGIHAVPSYELFPNTFPDPEDARSDVKKTGAETIVVTELKRVKEAVVVVPGAPRPPVYWGAHYTSLYAWDEGRVNVEEVVAFESSLWDALTGRLIWSAWTQTTNPMSNKDFVPTLTKELTSEWTQADLLPKQ
jgi:hypothetical protein